MRFWFSVLSLRIAGIFAKRSQSAISHWNVSFLMLNIFDDMYTFMRNDMSVLNGKKSDEKSRQKIKKMMNLRMRHNAGDNRLVHQFAIFWHAHKDKHRTMKM